MTEQEFKAALAAEQFAEAVALEREASYAPGLHEHPFDAFALITEGEITLDVDGQRSTYRAGQAFRLAAGTPHQEFVGPQGVRYLSGRRVVAG